MAYVACAFRQPKSPGLRTPRRPGQPRLEWFRRKAGPARPVYSHTGGNFIQSGAHAPFGEAYSYSNGYPRDFTGQENDGNIVNTTYYFPERQYRSSQGRWLSPDPAGVGAADPSSPQSWNRYAYVMNNPLGSIDPDGLECVWDDGSYDGEDIISGVASCENAGGTWVELGQHGNWSSEPDPGLATLVASIQNGEIASVEKIGVDGQTYTTFYNSAGQTTETETPDATIVYLHGSSAANNGTPQQKPPQPKKPCTITDKLNAANKKAVKLFLRDMAVGEGAAFLVGCGIGAPAGAPFGGPIAVIGGCAGGGVAAAGAALPLTTFVSGSDASIEAYSGAFSDKCD
ncbi:MAG TPA: RHS repeat-associated core domain-containing protein [Candidatus Sulfotelmatobacter sp.]